MGYLGESFSLEPEHIVLFRVTQGTVHVYTYYLHILSITPNVDFEVIVQWQMTFVLYSDILDNGRQIFSIVTVFFALSF